MAVLPIDAPHTADGLGRARRARRARARDLAADATAVVTGVAVLWAFAVLGDLIASAARLPVPGSVIGMLLLWAMLEGKLVRLRWIEDAATVLLALLGLLFVPAGAGFVQFVNAGTAWLKVGAIVVGGSLLTLAIGARIAQRGLRHDG